ncbi:MAG: glycosyltransferase family 4 protein [Anaerolinea sp.]|nr:glycosyltransferase family 4 protein [Anaerolinea sp.]
MKRIGLLAADLTYFSGWAHYSLNIIQALRASGVHLTVLTARNSPAVPGLTSLPILPTVDPLDRRMMIRMLRVYPRARAAMANCDVIHALIEPYAPLAALLAGERPLIITGHGSYLSIIQRRPRVIRDVYRRALLRSTIACVSHYTAGVLQALIPGLRTVVIPNGVDFARYGAIQHVGGRVPTVLSIGAVKGRKGMLELVQAIARVREHLPTVQCRIIGSLDAEPETVARVRAAIHDLDLAEHVHLLGKVPDTDLLDHYAAADVFVLASVNVWGKFEGYGLALAQASAAGLPIIGSRDCGAEEVVQHEETGLLIPQGSDMTAHLAAGITRLLTDTALAARMGAAGRAWAQTQTWERAAARLLDLYG